MGRDGERAAGALTRKDREVLARRARKARLDSMQRHVLVCTEDDCAKGKDRARRMRHRIAAAKARDRVTVSEVGCLGICEKGPICAVYPEGVWYGKLGKALCDRIVDEHLLGDRVVVEAAFLHNDLDG